MYLRSSWTPEFRDSLVREQFSAEEFMRLIVVFREQYGAATERARTWSWFMLGGVIDDICGGPCPRATAMHERHFSLQRMRQEPRMDGWRLESRTPACTISDEAVALASATAPIHWDRSTVAFGFAANEFFDILLRESPPSSAP
jgi:hypothetical protein